MGQNTFCLQHPTACFLDRAREVFQQLLEALEQASVVDQCHQQLDHALFFCVKQSEFIEADRTIVPPGTARRFLSDVAALPS